MFKNINFLISIFMLVYLFPIYLELFALLADSHKYYQENISSFFVFPDMWRVSGRLGSVILICMS